MGLSWPYRGSPHLGVNISWRDAFDGGKDLQVFLYCEHIENDVELGADSHQPLHLRGLGDLRHRGAVDGGRAAGGQTDAAQDVQKGGLSSTTVAKQSRDLALIDIKRQT